MDFVRLPLSCIKLKMPASCCIKNCRNKKKDGISLFKFPLKREDHLKKWLQNIGDLNFKPRKLDVICSAHFQQKDFMSKRGENGLLLNYSAVPSIFHSMSRNESPQISIVPEDSIANPPTTFVVLKNSVVDLPSTSAIVPTDHQYCATLISNLSTSENTSMNVSGIVQDSKKKKKRIMHSSTLHFKSQEISPRKKQMQREIKTLKEKLRRKDEKLLALQDLVKQLSFR
ncbi:THAP domain-containing protein 1-like isoform X2 [Odontomachus brunneus]|uniref:THAP domain-containing protein 1-like isoform X2 n=1 Tax=Odontomachus brunneus TaxID=486640 RepID=UPI0013F2AAD0|nr:THAP domain-containing protein 1-like isoform X2 [Odontomachus brunneus]